MKNKGLNTGARERRGRTVRSVASEPIPQPSAIQTKKKP